MKHLVIAGCGDLGVALGQRMLEQGWQVSGLRRDPSVLPEGFGRIAADLTDAQRPADWPARVDYLVYAPAAGRGEADRSRGRYVEGLQHVLGWLRTAASRRATCCRYPVPPSMARVPANG